MILLRFIGIGIMIPGFKHYSLVARGTMFRLSHTGGLLNWVNTPRNRRRGEGRLPPHLHRSLSSATRHLLRYMFCIFQEYLAAKACTWLCSSFAQTSAHRLDPPEGGEREVTASCCSQTKCLCVQKWETTPAFWWNAKVNSSSVTFILKGTRDVIVTASQHNKQSECKPFLLMLDEFFEGENCEIESLYFSIESLRNPSFQQHMCFEGEIELLKWLHLMFPIHFSKCGTKHSFQELWTIHTIRHATTSHSTGGYQPDCGYHSYACKYSEPK